MSRTHGHAIPLLILWGGLLDIFTAGYVVSDIGRRQLKTLPFRQNQGDHLIGNKFILAAALKTTQSEPEYHQGQAKQE